MKFSIAFFFFGGNHTVVVDNCAVFLFCHVDFVSYMALLFCLTNVNPLKLGTSVKTSLRP